MFDPTTLLLRLADFHLGAMLLLSATLVAGYFLGQPARRLTLAWSAAVAIAVLGVLCCVPGWSMLHVFRAEVPQGTVAWPSEFEKSLSQAATGFQTTPAESFQVAPSTSPSAEIIAKSPVASFAFDPTLAAITVGTLGTLLCSVWLIAGALSAKRIIRAATPAGERLQNLLREVATEKTLPRLLVSDRLSVAAAIGLWRPAILLPVSIDATATDEDLRGLLAHELAHVRNGDLRLLALWRLLLVALWINPLYWLLRRRMRLDQETLADAVAADQTNRQEYAERLVGWAREMSTGPGHPRLAGAAGLWENPSQLRRRIAVLLDERFTLLRRCSRRWRAACLLAAGSLAVAASLVTLSPAEPTKETKADFLPDAEAIANLVTQQEMLTLPVRVVNEEGEPIEGAKITPWALRCSQGHILWDKKIKDSKFKQKDPVAVTTDADGFAEIQYPLHVMLHEKVVTTAVTLRINHPEYGYRDSLNIAVDTPLEESPYSIELIRGIPLEIKPSINGEPVDLENISATYTGKRAGEKMEKTPEGVLRITAMKPGLASVRLYHREGEKTTHISPSIKIDLVPGKTARLDVPLLPAQIIHGRISDNVPRPVRDGRIQAQTLPPTSKRAEYQVKRAWVPIQSDGTFTIESWPVGETLQIIALCDGFHATSGAAPKIIENSRTSSQIRPQVFESISDAPIEVAMTPLIECVVDVVNQEGEPLADAWVNSCPNVQWWNGGATIYCVSDGDYLKNSRLRPYNGKTNAQGRTVLSIPAGRRSLSAGAKGYEMPILLGSRRHRVQLTVGKTTNVKLTLQPKGTESLGDWDKLAGVVFGCSTREGKRICALPGVQKKMDALRKRMREADDPRNPALLAEAYTAIAEALDDAGDAEEAAKWRVKAAEQAGEIEASGDGEARKQEKPPLAFVTKQVTHIAKLPLPKTLKTQAEETELAGVVIDESEQPLANVKVDAWTWHPGNETVTNDEGRFRLTGFDREEAVEVLVSKEGFSPSLFIAQKAGTDDWTILLTQGTWIEGKVLNPQGEPASNATIKAKRGPFRNPHVTIGDVTTETQTNEEGLYRLLLEPGTYDIQVRVPGTGAYRQQEVEILHKEKKTLDIQLEGGVTFQAIVRDSLTKQPVEGIVFWSWRERGVEGVSDEEGLLEITGMMEGDFEFNISAEEENRRMSSVAGEYARWWSKQAIGIQEAEQRKPKDDPHFQRNLDGLTFKLGGDTYRVDVFVEPAVTITGRVLDPDGNTVSGATVSPARTGSGNSITGDSRYSYSTDEEGRFTMRLPASKNVEYNLVAHDGKIHEWRNWANGVCKPFRTTPGQSIEDFDLHLTRPATVRGQIVNSQGTPSPHVKVRAAAFDKLDNRYYLPETETDAEGKYELRFIRPGKLYIQMAPFWPYVEQGPSDFIRILELKPGVVKEGIDFVAR